MRETRVSAQRCAAAAALGGLVVAAPSAGAPPTDGSGGGAQYVATPKIAKVTCVKRCASRKRAQGGSRLKLKGSELAGVTRVTFEGSYGDDR